MINPSSPIPQSNSILTTGRRREDIEIGQKTRDKQAGTTLVPSRQAIIMKTKERREVFSECKIKDTHEFAPEKATPDFALATIPISVTTEVPKLNLTILSHSTSN